ncbi:hypothetical protein SASPL_140215 [Salvia splendens]|uniref:RGS domain-containing protein n=1 Tax=Salvia splendens TaxID=180675 RepID=A0A8X8WRU6_SALSN|nr:hypothetical protein SASPL_140215 [Salvia splendens]
MRKLLTCCRLLAKAGVPYLIHKIPRPKGSGFWLVAMQVIASFNLLLLIVMALGFLRFRRKHWWSSCYIWAGDVFHPSGRLYFFHWLSFPGLWVRQIIPVISVHALYIAALVGFTGASQHIEFRFHELKDLWRGILVSACCIGVWVVAYTLNEIYEGNALIQIISRSVLLIMTSFLLLAFFSMSMSQPLASLLSSMKNDQQDYTMMGRALSIPDSGLLVQQESTRSINPNDPLDKLLENRRFRQSVWDSVHFYEELLQLEKISVDDHVRRISMARHIIDTCITPGATMKVNISHRCRQEILSTPDLAHPDLFKNALIELMKMNLANDYWSSTFFIKLKEEEMVKTADYEQEQSSWNSSHRLSSVHCADDPFHQEHSPCKLSSSSLELELHSRFPSYGDSIPLHPRRRLLRLHQPLQIPTKNPPNTWSTFIRPEKDLRSYGSWVAITGSTDGIGKSIAFDIAARGLNLVLIGRNPSKLEATSREIRQIHCEVKVKTVTVDFSDALRNGEEMARYVEAEIRGLDLGILIYSAGLAYPYARFMHEVDNRLMESVVGVNAAALTWITRAAVAGMMERGRGAIVNIGSGSSACLSSYVAMLSKSLNLEYEQYGIDVQCQAFLISFFLNQLVDNLLFRYLVGMQAEGSEASLDFILIRCCLFILVY